MIDNAKINVRQFTILVTVFTIGSSILVSPSGLAFEANRDAWVASIAGTVVSACFIMLYNLLGSRFPNKTLMEYSPVILGKWVGSVVSFLFIVYFFIIAGLLLREISDFITTQIMPETPIQYIQMLYVGIVIMAVRLGIETFTRAAEIFFPWIMVLFFLLALFLLPEIDLKKMQPVLSEGINPVLRAAFSFLGLSFLETVVFLMVYPSINRKKEAGKAFLIGTWLGGGVLIVTSWLTILVLGADFTARNVYPSYTLAKKINIAGFLERLEVVMAGIWFLSLYFKLTLCFYASAKGLAQILKLKDHRSLLLPLGMILINFSILLSPNLTYFRNFLMRSWPPFSLTIGLFLPLLLAGISFLRGKKG